MDLRAQLDFILWLQSFPTLAPLMKIFTFLGNEEFFLLLLPLIYLCFDARAGFRLGLLVLCGDTLNVWLKTIFAQPRPFWIDTRVAPLGADSSFGLPSSHAQNATSVWFYLARLSSKRWTWLVAALIVFLVSLSRVYLGVHFSTDVVSGWFLGAAFLGMFWHFEPRLETRLRALNARGQIAFVTLAVALIIAVGIALKVLCLPRVLPAQWAQFDSEARSWEALASRAGALWGLGIGAIIAFGHAPFEARGTVLQRSARFVLAVVVLLILWRGLAAIFPREPESVALLFRFIRYALMTLWVTFGAPWIFLRCGLAAPRGARTQSTL